MSDSVSPVTAGATLRPTPAQASALLLLDETGRVTATNAASCDLWQAAEVELIGEHFTNLFFFEIVSQKPDWLEAEWDVLLAATIEKTITLKAQPREGAPREVRVHLEKALGHTAGYFATIAPNLAGTMPSDGKFSSLGALAEKGAVGFFDLRLRDGRVYYSPSWKRILGYADGDLPDTYDTWLQLIHPDDSSAAPDKIGKKKVVGQRPFSIEFRMKHQQGHYVWLQSIGLQFVGDDGVLERVIGTHLDITERKEVEESGLASDDRLQALTNETGPVAAFEIDLVAQTAWFSDGWKKLFGYNAEDLTGPDSLLAVLPPEENAVDLADFFVSRSLGQPSFVETTHISNSEGQFVPVVLGASCKFNRKRELTRVVGFFCTIQPERGGLPAMDGDPLPDALLDATFAALAESVLVTNGRSEVLYVNAAASRLLGVAPRAAVGRPLREIFRLVNLEDGQAENDPVQSVLNGDKPLPLIDGHALLSAEPQVAGVLPTRAEKSLRPIVWTARAALDPDGRALGAVIVFRDPQEMSLTPDELVKTSRFESLGFMASGLAQEFNTLLTTILGAVSLVKVGQNPAALEDAEKACLAAKELTRHLITFAKGGTDTRSLTSPREIFEDAVKLACAGSTAEISIKVPPGTDGVIVERTPMLQVFQNLLINALQAMPPLPHAARMELSATNVVLASEQVPPLPAGNYVAFEVRDNASGIYPEHLQKIWERFFTTRKHGTGLGLATALSIVNKHGGQIGVDSTPGVGSSFTVFLPAADRPVEVTSNRLRGPRFRTGRVLLLDDDPKISELTASMLQSLDYKFDVVKTGEDALSIYKRYFSIGRAHDAILMDVNVGGAMTGEACFKALRDLDPGVRAIVSSNYDNEATTKQFLEMGFSGHLTKPYRVSDLGKMLKTVIG